MKSLPFILMLFAVSSSPAADSGGAAPATVTKEGDLVVVTLKPDAEQRLRLKIIPVEKRRVPGVRVFSGEVVYSLADEGGGVAPVLGGTLDEVLRLADLQAAADGRVQQAKVQIDAAKIAVERAQKMLNAEAGSVRAVDESKTALSLAEGALATAQAQRSILGDPLGKSTGSRRIWVRVAVYSGEVPLLDPKAAASIRPLGFEARSQSAQPVAGPPTANGLINTVDWYYQLPPTSALRAGERIEVEIPTADSNEEKLVIPFKAVLYDIHGGQWVYAQTGEHAYTRRRVQVARISGTDAVLASGLSAGSKIVTDGATELFGTEFMTGK